MPAKGSTAVAELIARAPLSHTWVTATTLTPVGFYPKSGPLPAVVSVRHQTGAWDAPGQTRTLMLSDGGSVVESTTNVESPEFFAYNLSNFKKLFGLLVDGARAEWTFAEVDGGTSIRWTYTFFAKRGAGPLVSLIVGALWGPYMRKVLPGITAEIERTS